MKKIVVIEPGYRDYEEEKQVLAEFDPVFEIVKLPKSRFLPQSRTPMPLWYVRR